MQDLISRQAAIDAMTNTLWHYPNECYRNLNEYEFAKGLAELGLKSVPSAQPKITDEQAIEHLQESGWMQNHDKQMYEMGLREQLADDSDSYDALLPPTPERKTGEWIPVTERLPEEAYPVIVTWKNDDPASYYQYVLGKHYVGVAHYKNGKWFWYSSITEDVLMEYGRCDSEEFDEAIKVLAWMPLPEPYKEGQDGER